MANCPAKAASEKSIALDSFDAIILDLDGVITKTAKVHAAAWKEMFDDYLASHQPNSAPFDIKDDYLNYVDGKPRYDGVRSFLASRRITLSEGHPDDPPGKETICGLGNRKNALFLERLQRDGVEVYPATITLIRRLRQAGLRSAVVSSSRNCQEVLQTAALEELFDARVDGVVLQQLALQGKPAPDMFLEASRRLECAPSRCIGVEDAIAGVEALHAAGFGCVVGVNRTAQGNRLRSAGADLVVADLGELRLQSGMPSSSRLPSALDHLDEIVADRQRPLVLFLDYDGTLTPIVPRPEDAHLSESMRTTLQRLATLCPIAVISGRDLNDVRNMVGIAGIWYAGSHGFDIAGPAGQRSEQQEGRDLLPVLDTAEQELHQRLSTITGCRVERKRFAIAIHYRQVAEQQVAAVKQQVAQVQANHPELRMNSGKKIFELQPDIEWDKGKALRWLMQALGVSPHNATILYFGDDVTDEDVFRELVHEGVGILVAEEERPTRAAYRLADPAAVERFLLRLATRLEAAEK